jgi:hypothetical protein
MRFFGKRKDRDGNESPEKKDPFHPYRSKKREKASRSPVPWAKLRTEPGGSRVLSWGMGDGRGGEIRIDGPPVSFSIREGSEILVTDGERENRIPAGGENSANLLLRKIEREFRKCRISTSFRWAIFLVASFILISLLTPARSVGSVTARSGYSHPSEPVDSPPGSVGKKIWTVPSSLLSDSDLRRSYGNIGLSCSAGH